MKHSVSLFFLAFSQAESNCELPVAQEFEKYCTSCKEALCKIGQVQAMFSLPFLYSEISLKVRETDKFASSEWPVASPVRDWVWHEAFWPGLLVVSAFDEGN